MKYEIKDIVFDGNNKYNPKLYWDLYRIYDAYNDIFKNNKIVSLVEAAHMACNTGLFCFNKIIKDDLEITKELEEFLDYKNLLLCIKGSYSSKYKKINDAKNKDELNEICNYQEMLNDYKFGHKYFKSFPRYIDKTETYYLDKCKNFIPKNIYEQIENKKIFSYGFIKEKIYNQLKDFYTELEKWLMNPIECDNNYDLEIPILDNWYGIHDALVRLKFENTNYILSEVEYEHIFKNAEILYNDIENYDNLDTIEGYCDYCIKRTNDNRIEFCLEFHEGTIILECDSAIVEPNFDNSCFKNFKDVKFNVKREDNKFILESDSQIIEFNNYEIMNTDIKDLRLQSELVGYYCQSKNYNSDNGFLDIIKNTVFKRLSRLDFDLQFKEGFIFLECDSVNIIDK